MSSAAAVYREALSHGVDLAEARDPAGGGGFIFTTGDPLLEAYGADAECAHGGLATDSRVCVCFGGPQVVTFAPVEVVRVPEERDELAERRERKTRKAEEREEREDAIEREAVERVKRMVASRREIRLGTVCVGCHGEKSRGAERCWSCYQEIRRDIDARGQFIRTIPPEAHVCMALGPNCAGRKVPTSSSCWPCYWSAGGHTGRRHTKRLRGANVKIDQATLDEARRLYDSGLSMRTVAGEVLLRTEYRSARSAASSLFEMFGARGWPLRERTSATADSNRERHAALPQCERVPTQGVREGVRCEKRVKAEPYLGEYLCAKHLPKSEQRRREAARKGVRRVDEAA